MRATRPALRLLSPVLAAGLLLTACGGGEDSSESSDSEEKAASQAGDPATWPLTGLPVGEGKSAEKSHPVYAVKIDNTANSAPQVGVGKADLVVEELVEGGTTRLAAMFYSRLPKQVGPVRSMRPSDVGIVAPSGGTIVTSGAARFTIRAINEAEIPYLAEGAPAVTRDDSRPAPYNVMADLKSMGSHADQKESRPDDYLPWGESSDLPKGKSASKMSVDFGNHVSQWSHRKDGYTLTNGYMGAADSFSPDTVVVAKVRTTNAPYKDPGGADVPISHFTGQGPAWVFHDGRMVRGTWHKDGEDATPTFTTSSGEDLTIPAGKVWLELIPKQGGSVQVG